MVHTGSVKLCIYKPDASENPRTFTELRAADQEWTVHVMDEDFAAFFRQLFFFRRILVSLATEDDLSYVHDLVRRHERRDRLGVEPAN